MAARVATAPRRRGDTIVLATGGLAVLAVVWFLLNLSAPWGWSGVGWLPGPLALAPGTLALWRLGGEPGLAPAGQRFWRQLGVASGVITLGSVYQSFAVITGLAPTATAEDAPLPTLVLFTIGLLIVLWALVRLPVGARSRAQWLHLILDGATVMAAAVLFSWYFAIAPLLTGEAGSPPVWGYLIAGVLAQLGLAAVVKLLLAGTGPVDSGALRILSLSLLVGALSTGLTPLIADKHYIGAAELITAPIAFLDACVAARQRMAARAGTAITGARMSQRPYSLLPYLALVATDLLLVFATIGHVDRRTPVVVAGAIAVTSLVAVRQLAAFIDNAGLLRSLREHEDQLHHQATHDSLTDLANRALFGDRLRATLVQRHRAAVLLIDLDDFKIINDTLAAVTSSRSCSWTPSRKPRSRSPSGSSRA